MRKIYTSVDIGSSSIKIVVSEYFEKKFNVLASILYPCTSIKKGVVIDEKVFEEELKQAFKTVNSSLGLKIDKVITNVPIYDAKYTLVDGYTTITNDNGIITGNDMVNALQASIYNKIKKDEELVTVIPIEYELNDDKKLLVKEPKGLSAEKLKVFAMMITVPTKNIITVISTLEKIGIEVVDILFGSLGDYYTFKEKSFDNECVGVINIGSDKIELTTFNNGIITNSTVLQDGAKNIDSDVAYVYNIKMSQAKKLREIFAVADKVYANKNEVYEVTNKSQMKTKINQYEISDIISNKLKEMLQNAKKELNHLTKKEIRYIIITGGISNMPGFDDLAREVLSDKAINKRIDIIGIRDNSYSSAIGMIQFFVNKLRIRGKAYSMFDEEKEVELIDTRNNKSFFGKVFNYLTGNKED